MIRLSVLTPYSEIEEVEFSLPVKIWIEHYTSPNQGHTYRGYCWSCFCGQTCKLWCEVPAQRPDATGGTCQCKRVWNADCVDMTALLLRGSTGYDREGKGYV